MAAVHVHPAQSVSRCAVCFGDRVIRGLEIKACVCDRISDFGRPLEITQQEFRPDRFQFSRGNCTTISAQLGCD